jgi:N-acetyl-anhydromuramyl-L-alanine amidase AmpD
MDFLQARNFTPGPRTQGPIRLIVVHDMESPETVRTAEDCANFFHNQPPSTKEHPGSSCHYCVDEDTIVASVHDWDIAWHCPGANHDGIGIEHAGYARQSRDEWLDEYGLAMLRVSADLVVDLCVDYGLPFRWLSAAEVAAGMSGITTHAACTEAFHTAGGHTDPGPNFPDDVYIRFIAEAAEKRRAPIEEDEDVPSKFLVGPITEGPFAGRYATVTAEPDLRQLRCVLAAWVDGAGVEQFPKYATSILHLDDPAVTAGLGHPVDWPSFEFFRSPTDPRAFVVRDSLGDYTFRVAP